MTSQSGTISLTNVRVFPGYGDSLTEPLTVRITGSTIESVDKSTAEANVVIDGGGRTLIPGLIDAHWHAAFASLSPMDIMSADAGYIHLKAGHEAKYTLLRGFTTVRDAGGPSFALKRIIDEGVIEGPRIFPSGACISQTAGHGDSRQRHEVPASPCRHLGHLEMSGASVIADGADQVLRASREQLMLGASQLKLMAGGGIGSIYDPIDVTQYTEPELRAAVDAAENWGTYVMVHAYTSRAITQAVRAGVQSIEHGQLADERAIELMADHGTWWSLQPFLDDEDAIPITNPGGREKQLEVAAGTDRAYALAKKHGVRVAWGTDTLFDAGLAARQGQQLAKMTRWFTPAEALTMATSGNAELLGLSGPRNPYPGVLGRIEPGAYADLLVVDGNPLEDLTLLAHPDLNLAVIMKDGVIHKNTLT